MPGASCSMPGLAGEELESCPWEAAADAGMPRVTCMLGMAIRSKEGSFPLSTTRRQPNGLIPFKRDPADLKGLASRVGPWRHSRSKACCVAAPATMT